MELSKEIKWSPTLENYFVDLGEKSYCYGLLHKKCEALFSKRTNMISLPVIILSTIAGTLSISTSSLFPSGQETTANILIGCVSLFVSILSVIESYFNLSKRAENHRLCSIEYFRLFRFISIEMSLPIDERMVCSDLLKTSRETFERLQEISPLIPDSVLDEFKQKFMNDEKYDDISKPAEANGLESITIYHDDTIRDKALVDVAINKFLRHKKQSSNNLNSSTSPSSQKISHVLPEIVMKIPKKIKRTITKENMENDSENSDDNIV
jgi:hypothetical protein